MWLKFLLFLSLELVASDVPETEVPNRGIYNEIFSSRHQKQFDGISSKFKNKVKHLFIEQKLNHFNESDERTWQMFYMANDEFFWDDGPMFIYLGGEENEIKGNILLKGHLYDTARAHMGYIFRIQHRYYGQSRPTEDLSLENLRYLNARQALADIAHFIHAQKELITSLAQSKVILVGSGYAGALAIWFKKLFPKLVTGVWASSPPLLAKLSFPEYRDAIGQAILSVGGEACYERVERSIKKSMLIIRSQQSQFFYTKLFLCSSFKNHTDHDVSALFNGIDDIFSDLVEKHTATDELIQNACELILQASGDIAGLAEFFNTITNYDENKCKDLSYEAFINPIKSITFSSEHGFMRQWFYQSCNEFGHFPTSNSETQAFGANYTLSFFIKICQDAFGSMFTESHLMKRIETTNQIFGGLNISLENVHLTHGEIDPWRLVSIHDERATILPRTGHGLDFLSISASDSQEMRNSKQKFADLVSEWVETE